MNPRKRVSTKLLLLTLPSIVLFGLVLATAVEVWVRVAWNPRRGSPGLFLSDPVRGQRLTANYNGWFAGVPTRINNLGFRDDRDYDVRKAPNTFRILVLGDSVTFGHGSVHTYPRLLEDALRAWRPQVDWQVWNAGVPGYNTSQELAHLLDVGPFFQPNLVIVGFYENDLIDNRPIHAPGLSARVSSRVLSWVQRHVYSFEFYKRLGLQAAWVTSGNDAYRQRLEHLGTEVALLGNVDHMHALKEQQLTPYERLSDQQVDRLHCLDVEHPEATLLTDVQQQRGWSDWVDAVRGFQQLHKQGRYRIVFFLQLVAPKCPDGDFFFDGGGTRRFNDFLMAIIADGLPAVSTLDAFLHRRPSQMPGARQHAIGNANMTKAEVLFDYLRSSVLPPLLD